MTDEAVGKSPYLTADELRELSGYAMKSKQVAWLRKNGIHHYVRADGYAIVPRSAIEPPRPDQLAPKPFVPDLDAVRVAPKAVKAVPKSETIDNLVRRPRR